VSYVYAFLGFAALIILHEAGHFVAAKAVGMRVERFSLFFGPLLVKTRRGETEYGIGPIPLGGYVKITGMNPREETPEDVRVIEAREMLEGTDDPAQQRELNTRIAELEQDAAGVRARAYYNQPVWKRIVVILAGPAVNLLIAFAILAIIYAGQGQIVTRGGQPVAQIARTALEQPAASYLRAGDQIVAVNARRNPSFSELTSQISSDRCPGTLTAGCRAARPVTLEVRRSGALETFSIYPRYDAMLKRMRLGFEYQPVLGPVDALGAARQSLSEMWYVTHTTVTTLGRLFEPKQASQLHGVVGGFTVTQERFAYSSTDAFFTLALISLSLAVVNLFPFLPLDGGHVFWAVAEKVRGRRIRFETMERAGAVGFVLIIFIFVIGLSNDISTLTGSGFNAH
jgi:regulator of sigma E protease